MSVNDFIRDALWHSLEIIDGKWERERDWEMFVMTRQEVHGALQILDEGNLEMNDDYVNLTENQVLTWMAANRDLASEYLAMTLDLEADKHLRSQRARLGRAIATDAWKLHMSIVGLDEMWFREEHNNEEVD